MLFVAQRRLTGRRGFVAPLTRRGLIGALFLVFISAARELSTALFLYGSHTRTMSVMLMDMSEEGNFEQLSALGFVLPVSTIVIVGLGYRLAGRDFMERCDRS